MVIPTVERDKNDKSIIQLSIFDARTGFFVNMTDEEVDKLIYRLRFVRGSE